MTDKLLSFIDIETTGLSASYNRIIEIGIVTVKKNKVIHKFNSLINPEVRIDPFIESLTGISHDELVRAPTFSDVKDEILELLVDTVFVAHNVRFDYGFIKNEFRRFGIPFSAQQFCTVKFARLLFPEWKSYSLDTVIKKCNIRVARRHRAFDDALVIWEFYKQSQKKVTASVFQKAIGTVLRRPSVPMHISLKTLDTLPESPGVYAFYADTDTPLYIGKSVNIKDRVLSHFSSDHLSATEMKIARLVRRIQTHKTGGELGALLLESDLIKKMKPLLNRKLRNATHLTALIKTVTPEGYNSVEITPLDTVAVTGLPEVIGVFKSEKQAKEVMHELAKTHALCYKLLGLEKTKKYCFGFQLTSCKGACAGKEHVLKYNLRFDEAFYFSKIKPWPFPGPILIHENGEKEEGYLCDRWCYLGKIKRNEDIADVCRSECVFDYDVYRILLKFLQTTANMKKVTSVPPDTSVWLDDAA